MVSISESKLKKDFKLLYGVPVYEYFQKVRMQAAKDKLLAGGHSVKRGCDGAGLFQSEQFYDRVQKRVRSVTQ
ncbi:helix-turn-helix domain-containing protein [Puia sp. P3]|uniref:helix-turn-helix domain-containing protein n=1 Tax=Puia sp. P3 TaxID=3423952 RepID=UPI003D674A55